MVSVLSVTLNMPNIGLILYYMICVIITPIVLINSGNEKILQIFLPLLLPIASVVQNAGNPNMYQNLLINSENNKNVLPIISTFIISAFTIVGILWLAINISMDNETLGDGILIGLVTSILIFGFSNIIIPDLMEKGDKFINDYTKLEPAYKMHKYLIGFFLVICLLVMIVSFQRMYYVPDEIIIKRKIKF